MPLPILTPPPVSLTAFVGRAADLATLRARLEGPHRLICLLGPGGIGKSRLAAEAVRDQVGVAWCALDRARSVDALRAAVAASLGLDGEGADLLAALRSGAAQVLVLDNVEQVLDAAAETLFEWLRAAPRLKVLVTSRARLHLGGEYVHRVEPLSLGADGDAAALFISRGRAQVPGFDPDAAERVAIDQLVTRLDGNPLAIELAAARLAFLSPSMLLARIDQRFELLASRSGVVDDRQRTLRGAIEWSWQLLDAADRDALIACSVCRSWFDLALAEALLVSDPCPIERLSRLVDQSMLRVADFEGVRRFGFFESIRAFVRDAADPAARQAAADRHAAHVLAEGARLAGAVHGRDGRAAHRALLALRDELQAVVERSAAQPTRALAALAALHPIVISHGPLAPHVAALDALLPAVDGTDAARAHLLRGQVLRLQGRLEDSRAALEQAARQADGAERAEALCSAGIAAHEGGDLDAAAAHYDAAIEAFGALDDARGLGRASGSLAILAEARGQVAEAQTRYEQALDQLRQAGDGRSEAIFLINLGDLHLQQDHVAEAEARYERALALLDEHDDARVRAVLLGNLGAVDQRAGRLDAAVERRTAALEGLEVVGDRRLAAIFQGYRGTAHHEAGRRVEARADYDQAIAALKASKDRRFEALFVAHRARLNEDTLRLDQLAEAVADDPRLAAVVQVHRGASVPVDQRGADLAFARRLQGITPSTERPALWIAPDARGLQAPGEDEKDISRRHTLRRLVLAFAEARESRPGEGMSVDALIQAGWPDERILPHAAANRVYVAIATLRKLGLRDVLLSREDGYLLDPQTPLVRARA